MGFDAQLALGSPWRVPMPLDKSLLNSSDAWSEPDAFSAPFDKAASQKDIGEQRVAVGSTMPEPVEHGRELFVDNSALERPYKPAEPWPVEPVERPRPEYRNIKRLLGGRPVQKMDEEVAPAPSPKRARVNITAINRLQPRAAVEQSTPAEKEAQRAALASVEQAPSPPTPTTSTDVFSRLETQGQEYFVDLLLQIGSGDRDAWLRLYQVRFGMAPTAVLINEELQRIIAGWFTKNALPQTPAIDEPTFQKAVAAAQRFVAILSRGGREAL